MNIRLPPTLSWYSGHCETGSLGLSPDLVLDLCHGLGDLGVPGHDHGRSHQAPVFSFAHVDQNRARNFVVCDVLYLFDLASLGVCDVIDDGLRATETGFVFVLQPCSMLMTASFGGVEGCLKSVNVRIKTNYLRYFPPQSPSDLC